MEAVLMIIILVLVSLIVIFKFKPSLFNSLISQGNSV